MCFVLYTSYAILLCDNHFSILYINAAWAIGHEGIRPLRLVHYDYLLLDCLKFTHEGVDITYFVYLRVESCILSLSCLGQDPLNLAIGIVEGPIPQQLQEI
jgi:hypothetical protein